MRLLIVIVGRTETLIENDLDTMEA